MSLTAIVAVAFFAFSIPTSAIGKREAGSGTGELHKPNLPRIIGRIRGIPQIASP
jgi:hypothetical protein